MSHAAPRRHFPDRKALLDAVATRGFERVTEALVTASNSAGPSASERFRAAAMAYVDFAGSEARVHDLMFTTKTDEAPEPLREAAAHFFAVSNQLLTPSAGTALPLNDPKRLLVIAALQGIAALRAGGRIDPRTTETVLDEATKTFFSTGSH